MCPLMSYVLTNLKNIFKVSIFYMELCKFIGCVNNTYYKNVQTYRNLNIKLNSRVETFSAIKSIILIIFILCVQFGSVC